jgi:hypothetical protein
MRQVIKRVTSWERFVVSLVAESGVGFLAAVLGAINKNHNTFSVCTQDALA